MLHNMTTVVTAACSDDDDLRPEIDRGTVKLPQKTLMDETMVNIVVGGATQPTEC